jgi:hypothetical protein
MTSLKRVSAAALLVSTLAAACHDPGSNSGATAGIDFIEGFAAGKAQAAAQSKPMLVYFTGDY